ncbi:heparinase II/III domain-containing protein [Gryllotalpicola ginsengisoli]|uniref:heparinase II/III domain-containing protein n=1 Tax=Gryllotalpicola ginsengisoli TaxID=444608 RepID=UPI0003B31516|nr:heparinase II/III family protein [Gryllotalpicola ginsengisoli]
MATAAPHPWAPYRAFPGPLRERWGDGMDAARLRSALAGGIRRLGIPDADDRAFWAAADPATVATVAEAAEAERGTAWPQPLLSHFARFWRDGDRNAYEDRVRHRQQRLARATIMAAVRDDIGWLDEVADGVALVCEQAGWSWAAHDDTYRVHGHVVPTDATPYLDLGAGELAAELAWIDHVLGARLEARAPGLREVLRENVHRRVIVPFLTRRDWHWLGLDGDVHNWNPWIHGNVLAAALLLLEGEEQAEVVARCLDGIDRYVATLPDDGATDEGFAYWWNGACRALEALDLIRRATGGELDAGGVPSLCATVGFPHRMHLGGDRYLNVADGPGRASGHEPWHVPFAWAARVGDDDARRHAAAQRDPSRPVADAQGGLARMLHALADPDWVAARPAAPPLVARSWLPSIQVFLARERAGRTAGLALAVKGGHNGEHHNHLDLGSYVVVLDGEPLVVDAGKVRYTAQTFSERRYEIRAMQSQWHSTPAPFGLGQGVGARFRAEVVELGDAAIALELARAYPLEDGDSWVRSARLDRAGGGVEVADEWRLDDSRRAGAPVAVHQLLRDGAELQQSGAAGLAAVRVPRPGGGAIVLEWDAPEASVRLERWELDDPELQAAWGAELVRASVTVPASTAGLTTRIRRGA